MLYNWVPDDETRAQLNGFLESSRFRASAVADCAVYTCLAAERYAHVTPSADLVDETMVWIQKHSEDSSVLPYPSNWRSARHCITPCIQTAKQRIHDAIYDEWFDCPPDIIDTVMEFFSERFNVRSRPLYKRNSITVLQGNARLHGYYPPWVKLSRIIGESVRIAPNVRYNTRFFAHIDGRYATVVAYRGPVVVAIVDKHTAICDFYKINECVMRHRGTVPVQKHMRPWQELIH